ncbi:MAG: HAMP domain-containing histidine kinase, partial [Anaerolineae bacterium]|nr:HAMP domain-containing histidine kinase [Anaerolineae bacterium]
IFSPFNRSQFVDMDQETPQSRKDQSNWRAEGQLKRKDGTLFDASIYTAEVRDAQGQPVGIIEIIRDTSPEKALHHHRDTFITNAAHELRGPLANLKTRLYLLKRQPEKTHEHLEVVDRAIDNMADLVNDLVDLAHFTQGELKLNQRKVELQHILRSTLSIQEPHAFQTRVDVKKLLPAHPIYIYADHQRLVQTFNNLLANAIQSTSPDGRVDLTVSLPNNGSSKWVTIQIRNNGPVLDQNHLALIFEPFFRPSEGNIKRTGMDLAISKRIIEEHGGTISVSSQPTIGTTFTIQLPVHQPETGSAAKVSEPSKSN